MSGKIIIETVKTNDFVGTPYVIVNAVLLLIALI